MASGRRSRISGEPKKMGEGGIKRLCINCGICQGTKYYGFQRGIKKICSTIICENCCHFYQKLKSNPFSLDCISPIKGSCYKDCSFMKTRCKGCWAMQLLDSCPHPPSLYFILMGWLSDDCKKQMRGTPLKEDEVPESSRGKVIVEIFDGGWKEAPSFEEELAKLPVTQEEDVSTSSSTPIHLSARRTSSRTTSSEEDKKEDEMDVGTWSRASSTATSKSGDDTPSSLALMDLTLETEEDMIDLEEEEAMVDDPAPVSTTGQSSNTSERIKRKRKKVEYFTKPFTGRKTKGPIYGQNGKINKTGMDLCDCLQPECVGCHFPCPKCRSPKCGNECRVNRRWYYEKVEVEGTKMFWVNRFVPKI